MCLSELLKLRLYASFFAHSIKLRDLLEYVYAGLWE